MNNKSPVQPGNAARRKTARQAAAPAQGAPRQKIRAPLFALFLGAAFAQSAVRAQGAPAPAEPASQWGLGLGVGVEQKAYRGIDSESQALPLLMFENKWISVFGPSLDLKLPQAGPVSFRLRARYSGDGYEAGDAPSLNGMEERKDGFWLGGAAIWRNDVVNLSAELLRASGNSKGTKFRLGVDKRFSYGDFDFTPRLAATRVDDKYVSYYYGVNRSEVRAGRAFYQGGATVNVEAGLRIGYAIAPKQNVFLDLSSTRLGSNIKNSPLVDRSSQSGARVGYLYRF